MSLSATQPPLSRLKRIAQAREMVLKDATPVSGGLVEPWIEASWQRCLAQGQRPQDPVNFEAVSAQTMRRAAEGNRILVQAARPYLRQLSQALAETRYFAILTNHEGVVVDVEGPINRGDRRAALITRIGVDLSEKAVGTTAIGAALKELRPVWLHRGEHFFHDTSVYSCAGAPLFGPDGRCVGMLDLTGIEAAERPELRHLASQTARSIENALVRQQPHQLMLHIGWPGLSQGEDSEGLVALDGDGRVTAFNQVARELLPQLAALASTELHCRDLFALPFEMLFDAAHQSLGGIEAPMWSGLRLHVRATRRDHAGRPRWSTASGTAASLREVEAGLIRQAVEQTHGNVAQAARNLGISRATVYRKLGSGK